MTRRPLIWPLWSQGDLLVLIVAFAGLHYRGGHGRRRIWRQAAIDCVIVSWPFGHMTHGLEILLQLGVGRVRSLPLPLLETGILGLVYLRSTRLGKERLGNTMAWGALDSRLWGGICNLAFMISSSPGRLRGDGALTGLAMSTETLDMRMKDLLRYLTALAASSCDL